MQEIQLRYFPGFEVEVGASFYAAVEPCEDSDAISGSTRASIEDIEIFNNQQANPSGLTITPNPAKDWIEIRFETDIPSLVTISIEDQSGAYTQTLLRNVRMKEGFQLKEDPSI